MVSITGDTFISIIVKIGGRAFARIVVFLTINPQPENCCPDSLFNLLQIEVSS